MTKNGAVLDRAVPEMTVATRSVAAGIRAENEMEVIMTTADILGRPHDRPGGPGLTASTCW